MTPYTVHLGPDQAALVEPGTFLQLVNPGDATTRVLYVVGPAYVFEQRGEEVVYDDSDRAPAASGRRSRPARPSGSRRCGGSAPGSTAVEEMRAAREAALARLDGAQSAST